MPVSYSKNDSLILIFDQLKELLVKYETILSAKTDAPSRYDLEFDKDYRTRSERTGKTATKHGLYFAGLIVQKNYVGLYFMPIYSHPDNFNDIPDRLRRALKGKTCFYISKLDDELKQEIAAMLERGYRLYENFDGMPG